MSLSSKDLKLIAATLLEVATEIRPGFNIDPETDRPAKMPRAAWQRIVGAHNQRVALAARFKARADRYLVDATLRADEEAAYELGLALGADTPSEVVRRNEKIVTDAIQTLRAAEQATE